MKKITFAFRNIARAITLPIMGIAVGASLGAAIGVLDRAASHRPIVMGVIEGAIAGGTAALTARDENDGVSSYISIFAGCGGAALATSLLGDTFNMPAFYFASAIGGTVSRNKIVSFIKRQQARSNEIG